MNGQRITLKTSRAMMTGSAFATVIALTSSVIAANATNASAQTQGDAAVSASATTTNTRSMLTRIPGSVQPIVSRIAEMWVAANRRSKDMSLPASARESYGNAANALREALAAAHVRPISNGAARYNADLLVESGQLLDDISNLQNTSARMTGPRAADLKQVADLYANGAKEFFTGSIREALLSLPNSRNAIARADQSGVLGITSRRPNTTVPVMPMPNVPIGGQPAWALSSYGLQPDSSYWGADTLGVGPFGATVIGPGGVGYVPPVVEPVAPVVEGPAPTVGVPPTP